MSNESARQLIQQGKEALQRGDAARTLKLAEEAIVADESIAEGHQLRGIALTKLGKTEEATVALRRATEVAPYEPKHFYNLAVNLRDRGLVDEAKAMAKEAIRVDPKHPGARGLLGELGEEESQGSGPWTQRVGYSEQEHVLPFMYGTDKAWNGIGYGFLALGVVLAILMLVHLPMGPTGKAVPQGQLPDVGLRSDPLSMFVLFLWIVSGVLTFMWMFIDMIDRRTKFTWLVPLVICGAMGFNAIPLAMYLFIGRRFAIDGVPKP